MILIASVWLLFLNLTSLFQSKAQTEFDFDHKHEVKLRVRWDKERQEIEGFGVFAGRETPFYQSSNRMIIMDSLFGNDGLRLNIVRGSVYHNLFEYEPFVAQKMNMFQYAEQLDASNAYFNQDDQVLVHQITTNLETEDESAYLQSTQSSEMIIDQTNATEQETKDNQLIEFQLELLKLINKNYNVKIILSSWSPPYRWKRFPNKFGFDNRLPFNHLLKKHYNDFANYLVEYIKFYRDQNLTVYALSAQNEPEFPTKDWEGCYWLPGSLGDFVRSNLRPLLESEQLNTKIIGPENANPIYASFYSFFGQSWNVFSKNKKTFDISASHGYSTGIPHPSYSTFVTKWGHDSLPRWVTEASCTGNYDYSMNVALRMAESLHKFLTEADITAYVFWLGMCDRDTAEALIIEQTNKEKTLLQYPKVYYVYGQFTRYIGQGFQRVELDEDSSFESSTMNSFYLRSKANVNAYGTTDYDFALIIVNKRKFSIKVSFDLSGKDMEFNEKSVHAVETSDQSDWTVEQPLPNIINDILLETEVGSRAVRTVYGTLRTKVPSVQL